MGIVKNIFGGRLQALRYFYVYLKGKIFIAISLNILIGMLDGLGLSMFLPLIDLTDGNGSKPERMNSFVSLIQSTGIELTLPKALLFIVILFALKGVLFYLKGVFQVKLLQGFIRTIRLENLKNLSNLKYEYFVKADTGRIQNTLTGEVDKVSKACQSYFQSIQYFILVIVYVLFAVALNWKFAVLVCLGGILSDTIYRSIYKNTKGVSRTLAVDSNLFQNLIFQAISNFKYLKATGEIRRYEQKLSKQVEKIEKNNSRIGILSVILNASREPLSIFVVCLAILLQTMLFHSPLSAVLISLLFFYRALTSLMQFQTTWNSYLALSGSLENIQNLNDELQSNKQATGAATFSSFTEEIEFQGVSFSYDNKSVLRNISFQIKKDETIAVVGESGSGKSTLINLICGLLPPGEGSIKIDLAELSTLNIESYQRRIGFITQENVVFNDSIFNNVTLWAEETPENLFSFEQACRKAAIWDFVERCEKGRDTKLGTNGINLSGGQRQRIAIARELFKDIDILILDEATSSLDAETENDIQQSIEELKGQLTLIIIAHRLSTIKPADRVAFLANGEMVAIDTFPALYAANIEFKNLVDLQEVTLAARKS